MLRDSQKAAIMPTSLKDLPEVLKSVRTRPLFPMVHRSGEVLLEDERQVVPFAKATIGEADAVGLYEFRAGGLMRVVEHLKRSRSSFLRRRCPERPTAVSEGARGRCRVCRAAPAVRNKQPR
jgi:hypothetical protein